MKIQLGRDPGTDLVNFAKRAKHLPNSEVIILTPPKGRQQLMPAGLLRQIVSLEPENEVSQLTE